jgi:hypothetical protein
MDWLKANWATLIGIFAVGACIYILALKVNQLVHAHNGFVRQTEERLQQLELKAALWEARENDRLAEGGILNDAIREVRDETH